MARAGRVPAIAVLLAISTHVAAAPPAEDTPSTQIIEASSDIEASVTVVDIAVLALAGVVLTLFVWRRWFRLDARRRSPAGVPMPIACVLVIAMFVLGQLGVGIAVQLAGINADPDTLGEWAALALGLNTGQAAVLIAYLLLRRRAVGLSAGTRQYSRPHAAVFGLCAMVLAWPVVAATAIVLAMIIGASPQPIAHETLRELMSSSIDGWWIVMVASVVLLTPVMEELLYRGLLQRILIDTGLAKWIAIVFVAAAFAAVHITAVEPHALGGLFVLGAAMGWAYEKTGRLTTPVVMHALFNAVNIAVAMTLKS